MHQTMKYKKKLQKFRLFWGLGRLTLLFWGIFFYWVPTLVPSAISLPLESQQQRELHKRPLVNTRSTLQRNSPFLPHTYPTSSHLPRLVCLLDAIEFIISFSVVTVSRGTRPTIVFQRWCFVRLRDHHHHLLLLTKSRSLSISYCIVLLKIAQVLRAASPGKWGKTCVLLALGRFWSGAWAGVYVDPQVSTYWGKSGDVLVPSAPFEESATQGILEVMTLRARVFVYTGKLTSVD